MKIQIVLVVLIALTLLLAPATANAQQWDRCYPVPHGTVCIQNYPKVVQITCDWGYQPRFGRIPRCVVLRIAVQP
jgi:hypothetical protein